MGQSDVHIESSMGTVAWFNRRFEKQKVSLCLCKQPIDRYNQIHVDTCHITERSEASCVVSVIQDWHVNDDPKNCKMARYIRVLC